MAFVPYSVNLRLHRNPLASNSTNETCHAKEARGDEQDGARFGDGGEIQNDVVTCDTD